MEIKTTAYPKVNLFLAVGKKRADGYHDISTIYYLVKDSVYKDEITINIEESDKTIIEVKGLDGVADSVDNTVYKAAELYIKAAGINANIKIDVNKNIPSQAGLGGGSSDAAAVLNSLCEFKYIKANILMDIAAEIGSDVPFFASGMPAATGLGRGEKVEFLPPREIKITLYPNENEKMSTKEAYEKLDCRKTIKPLPSEKKLKEMYYQPIEDWDFYNDFELVNKKCDNPRMKLTGSGTCRYMIDLIQP